MSHHLTAISFKTTQYGDWLIRVHGPQVKFFLVFVDKNDNAHAYGS